MCIFSFANSFLSHRIFSIGLSRLLTTLFALAHLLRYVVESRANPMQITCIHPKAYSSSTGMSVASVPVFDEELT